MMKIACRAPSVGVSLLLKAGAESPVWVADITYLKVESHWMYLSAIWIYIRVESLLRGWVSEGSQR